MLKSQLLGHLGRDAETRVTPEGVTLVTFNVCKQARKPAAGQPPPAPVWVSCTWRGDRAAKVAPYLQRGTKVLVGGDITLRTWQGREGPGHGLSINVDHLEFAGSASDKPASTTTAPGELPPVRDLPGQQRLPGTPPPPDFADDDSVPF